MNQPADGVVATGSGSDSASGISTLLSSCILDRQLTNHEIAVLGPLRMSSVRDLAQTAVTSDGQELPTKNFDSDLVQRLAEFFINGTRVLSGLE